MQFFTSQAASSCSWRKNPDDLPTETSSPARSNQHTDTVAALTWHGASRMCPRVDQVSHGQKNFGGQENVRNYENARSSQIAQYQEDIRHQENSQHQGNEHNGLQPAQPTRRFPYFPPYPQDDILAIQASEEGRRVFLGNLSWRTTSGELNELFARDQYEVVRLMMAIDPPTGQISGYCFVELATKDQAQLAVRNLNGTIFLRRPLKVDFSSLKRRFTPPSNGSPKLDEIWSGVTLHSDSTQSVHPNDRPVQQTQKYEEKKLFVGGLPWIVASKKTEVKSIVKGFKVHFVSGPIPLPPGQDGYFVIVGLNSSEAVDRATQSVDRILKCGARLKVCRAKLRETSGKRGHKSTSPPFKDPDVESNSTNLVYQSQRVE